MGTLPNLTLTNAGLTLLAKTPIGSPIPVTKWSIGTGHPPPGQDPADRTDMVQAIKELPISKLQQSENQCLVEGQLINTKMDAFTWSETGLYATDPDEGEILYAYGYSTDGVDIPAGSVNLREIIFGVDLVFDHTANLTANISKTMVFATLADLETCQAQAVEEMMARMIRNDIASPLITNSGEQLLTDNGEPLLAVRFL